MWPSIVSYSQEYPDLRPTKDETDRNACNCLTLCLIQGTNARKVISEEFASFVLQCTVFGRQCKYNTDVTAWHGIHLSHKKSMKYDIGNYYVNYQNFQNSMLLFSSDTKRTLMHLFLFTNSTQRELVPIFTQSIRNCN